MKKKLTSVLSVVLVISILLGFGAAIRSSRRTQPDNPITPTEKILEPVVWDSSGLLNTKEESKNQQEQGADKSVTPDDPEQANDSEKENAPDEEEQPDKDDEKPEEEKANTPDEDSSGEDDHEDPNDAGDDEKPEEAEPNKPGEDPSGEDDHGNPGDPGDDEKPGEEGPSTPGEDPSEEDDHEDTDDTGDDENTDSPAIATNLGQFSTVTQEQLPDGLLSFYAYGTGGDDLSVRVNVKPKGSLTNGVWLTSENENDYRWQMELGVTYNITVYLYQKGVYHSSKAFPVTWMARLADEDHPSVGDEPPVIKTTIDDYGDEIKDENLPLIITVYQNDRLEKKITADKIKVTLNGETVQKHGGDSNPEYDLYFARPNVGDEKEYRIEIQAWCGVNSSYWSKTLTYHATAEGDSVGYATIVLDATTVGCGILDCDTYEIVQGETAAETLLRFLDEYGYESTYDGTAKNAFYLRRIGRGDMCYDAEPDTHLWDIITRDGITLNSDTYSRDSLGEFDYTMGSGWMYAVNGSYPGRAMSNYHLKDGDTLYLRFTLAYGKDIDGYDATGGGYGSLSSYCGLWIGGGYTPLDHSYVEVDRQEPTAETDGYVEEKCSKCGDEIHTVLPAQNADE